MRAAGLIACALVLAAGRASPNGDQPMRSMSLSADVFELIEGDHAVAEGNAHLEYSGLSLQADALQANLATGEVSATGETTLTQDSRALTGEGLTYNLNTGAGRFERAEARSGLAVVRGREVAVEPTRYVMRDGSFTTCGRDPPHYRVTAEELIVYPGQRAVARKASFWVKNRRLFTMPKHSFSLRRQETAASGLFPKVGFSRADGVFAGLVYGYAPRSDVVGLAQVRLTALRGVRVLSRATKSRPWGYMGLSVMHRQDLTEPGMPGEEVDTGYANVTVDRLPEVFAHWEPIGLGRNLALTADVALGRYSESPGGAGTSRVDLRGTLEAGPFDLGGKTSLSETISLRPIWYGDGQNRFIWGTTTRVDYEASPRLRLGVSYSDRHPSGSTPFQFDQVEVAYGVGVELAADLSRRWAVLLEGKYEPRQATFRDGGIELTHRGDCLDYSMGWRKARGMVTFNVGFPANAFGP